MWRTKRDLTREQQWAQGPIDLPFLMLTMLLLGIGLVMLFSASSYVASVSAKTHYDPMYYFKRQAVFAALGIAVMYLVSRIDYQHMRILGVPVLMIAILLLVAVKVLPRPLAITLNGCKRWLNLGFTTFQPSEIAKIAVVIHFSSMLSKRRVAQVRMKEISRHRPVRKRGETGMSYRLRVLKWVSAKTGFGELVPYVAVLALIGGLLMLEPHMSATLLIFVAAAAILFTAGVHWGWFVLGGSLAGIGGFAFIQFTGYNSGRLSVWKDPWSDPRGKGFQIIQSLYAVSSGGVSGLGFGLSRQKYMYLPENMNDYIFAIVCEELGFIGSTVIVLLFALLVLRGYWLALHARDRFGSLMVVGVITLMAVQVALNIAVVTNLLPSTGISLPFFSYGGTALVIQMAEMGLVLAVSRQIEGPRHRETEG
jgi:cell division protein FtsW